MKYAIIENGKVVNVAVSDEPLADNWIQSDVAQIGDIYDGSTFTTPEPVIEVPESVPALNAMIAIDNAGLSSAFQAWVDSPDRTFVEKAYFAKAEHWRRNSPNVAAGGAALNLTDKQIDDLFIAASQIDP